MFGLPMHRYKGEVVMPTVYGLHLRATGTSPLFGALHSSAPLRDRHSDTPLVRVTRGCLLHVHIFDPRHHGNPGIASHKRHFRHPIQIKEAETPFGVVFAPGNVVFVAFLE